MVWRFLSGGGAPSIDVDEEEPFFRVYLERRRGVASVPTFLQESEKTFGEEAHSKQEAEQVLSYFSEHWNCRIYKRRGVTYYVFPEFIPDEVVTWLKRPESRDPEALARLFNYTVTEAEVLVEHFSKYEEEAPKGTIALRIMNVAEKVKPVGIVREVEMARILGLPPTAVKEALRELVSMGVVEEYVEDGEPVYVFKELARQDKLNELRVMRLKALRFLERERKKREIMEEAYREKLKIARGAESRIKELEAEIRRIVRQLRSLEAERQSLVEAGKLREAALVRDREIQLMKSKRTLEQEISSHEDFLREVRNYKVELLAQDIKVEKIERLIKDLELKIKIAESVPSLVERGEDVEAFIAKTRKYLEEEYREIEELEREVLGSEEEVLEELDIPEEILEELKQIEREVEVLRQKAPATVEEYEAEGE